MHRIKSAELLAQRKGSSRNAMRTILYSFGKNAGKVFGLLEVTCRDQQAAERLFHLVGSHLDVFRADLDDERNVPRHFEHMLVNLNADLGRFGTEYHLSLKHLNLVVGVMTEKQVFFSGTGNNHILFLHRTTERRYVVYELDAQLAQQESTWEKPLITVLDGELHPGDALYIATRIPPHALTLGDLQDIVVTLPPQGALERIQQFVPVTTDYAGLCFQIHEDTATETPKKVNPLASLSSLSDTQTRTAELLGDQTPHVTQKLSAALTKARQHLSAYSESALARGGKRLLRALLTKIESLLKRQPLSTGSARTAVHGHRKTSQLSHALFSLHHAGITSVKDATRTTKIIIGVVVVLLIFSGFRLSTNQARRHAQEVAATYDALVIKIEEKRTAAEAALIYGNTQDAQAAILDAQALLATLPADTATQKATAESFRTALNDLLNSTRGLENVTPQKIAELPAQFAFPIVGLTSAGSAMFAVTSDGAPWRVNEVSKALERQDVGTSPAQNIVTISTEDANILSLDTDKRLWRTTTGTPGINALTSGTNALANIEDIFAYNGSIYVLTSATEQIVKMRAQGLGFEAGTPWITSKTTSLTDAKALAIDGNIWVLTATDVIKFLSGRETAWNHAAIDPVLVTPIDIWTDVDSEYLYVLDGNDGRVVVFDKNSGNIVTQYLPNIPSVVGFTVRESENRIVLTTATTTYSFTATHLLK